MGVIVDAGKAGIDQKSVLRYRVLNKGPGGRGRELILEKNPAGPLRGEP